nr:dynamin family protein [uncultured Lachnoanaerobaculum sp.]
MGRFGQGLKEDVEQSEVLRISGYIREIMDMQVIQDAPFFYEQLKRTLERILDQSFRIAVVGEFSSGKSTFINALIGKDILKHGASETTATITEVENISDKGTDDYFEVYFEDGSVHTDNNLNNILDYTTTKSESYEVAKEIQKVVIHSKIIDTDKPLIFVDTPGLNGVADNHRDKTLNQIERAHACIYLIPMRGLGDSDIEFIRHILEFQQDIIFVQNFIDEFKESEGDSLEIKLREQNEIIKNKILSDTKALRYRIVGVSAKLALMAKDEKLLRLEGIEITKEVREEYLKESCWEGVQQTLEDIIKENQKNKNQILSSVDAVVGILMQLEDIVMNRLDIEKELWAKSSDGEIANKVRKLRDKLIECKDRRRKELKDFAISECSRLERVVKNKIEEDQDIAKEDIVNKIREITDIDDFESDTDNIIELMYTKVNNIQSSVNVLLKSGYQNILEAVLMRVLEYNAVESNVIKSNFTARSFKIEAEQFTKEEDSISFESKKLAREENAKKELEKKRLQYIADMDSTKEDIKSNEYYIVNKDREKQRELSRLGSEPALGTKTVTETYKQKRNALFNWILGEKEMTRQVQVVDDTNRRKWKENKARVERRYNEDIKRAKLEQSNLSSRLNELEYELMNMKSEEDSLRKRIEGTKKILQSKQLELEEKKRSARREYLENQKKDFIEQIYQYFEDIGNRLIDSMRLSYNDNKRLIKKEVERMFESGFELGMKDLENALKKGEEAVAPCEETLQRIVVIRENLERYIKVNESRANSCTK